MSSTAGNVLEAMAYREVKRMVLAHQKLLGLSDWDIRVTEVEGLLPTHYSALDFRLTERVAQIKIDRKVVESGHIEFIGRCLAHELIHLVLSRYEELVARAVVLLPDGSRDLMADLVDEELEVVVDTLAGLISPGERFVSMDAEEAGDWPSWGTGEPHSW